MSDLVKRLRLGIEYGPLMEDTRQEAADRIASLESALSLIATPKRPDGTWNRDREACQKLAEEALKEVK